MGWVSLATDSATEAIYPLLPFFLTRVLGADAVSLGIVEGAAEATNSVLKILSGWLADRSRSKRPLVLLGYSVSSAVRPLIAITTTRGKVYGFHRAMDHLGAVIGPAAATLFLWWHPGEYRRLFALTIVPGAIAVLLILFIKERDEVRSDVVSGFSRTHTRTHASAPTKAPLPHRFNLFMLVLASFTLGNSSDAFLLLRLTDVAGSVKFIPLMWSALHVVKASVSVLGGDWSDRVGRRTVIAIGWLVYAAVYVGFAV